MIRIRGASAEDIPLILTLIKELAEYERLSREVIATKDSLREWLFGKRPVAEVLIGELAGKAVGFALFFQNFSTFPGRPGFYLEDLYVRSEFRRAGIDRALLTHRAGLARKRGCGRMEWSVLDWNEPAVGFYGA